MHTMELLNSSFGISPKAFDAIDVGLISGEFDFTMINSQVLSIPHINQDIISSPAIGLDEAVEADLSSNCLLQRGFKAVRYDLDIDAAIVSVNTEDYRFPVCSTPSFLFGVLSAEKRFIDFNFPTVRGLGLTEPGQMDYNSYELAVDEVSTNPCKAGDRRCFNSTESKRTKSRKNRSEMCVQFTYLILTAMTVC